MNPLVVLITGGVGRLGRALSAHQHPGKQVIALPRERLDVTDTPSIVAALEFHRPDVIINAAAKTNVDECESMGREVQRVNAGGAANVAHAAAERGIACIQVSTDYVFGDEDEGTLPESQRPSPVNAYGRSKAEAERLVLSSSGKNMVLRTAWLFGDRADDFVGKIMAAAHGRTVIPVVDDQCGSPTPIDAAAETTLRFAARLAAGEQLPPILHVAGAPAATRADWAEVIFDTMHAAGGPLVEVERVPSTQYVTPARRPLNTPLCVELMRQLGEPPLDWRSATRRTVLARLQRSGEWQQT